MPMSTLKEHVLIFANAPAKPAPGAPCNGCGVCCLLEPCPLGVLLSGRRQGACQALRWQEDAQIYRCGAITAPREVLQERLPQFLQPATRLVAGVLGKLACRWVAAGAGCDCDAELEADRSPLQEP
jgi:hypothetical protein